MKQDGDDQIRILLFVDDLAISSDSTEGGKALKADLKAKIKAKYEYSTGGARRARVPRHGDSPHQQEPDLLDAVALH